MATVRLSRYEAQEGRLPPVCMVCGQQAARQFTHKTMYWHPSWVFILLLLGVLPFAIAALATQQRLGLRAPLCVNHQSHWFTRSLIIWLSLLGIVVLGIGCFVLVEAQQAGRPTNDAVLGVVCIGATVMLVSWVVLVIVLQSTAVRAKEITDRTITLTGVSSRFVEAMGDPEYYPDQYEDEDRPARRPRRAPPPYVDDEPDERPRRRPAPPDAYEDRSRE